MPPPPSIDFDRRNEMLMNRYRESFFNLDIPVDEIMSKHQELSALATVPDSPPTQSQNHSASPASDRADEVRSPIVGTSGTSQANAHRPKSKSRFFKLPFRGRKGKERAAEAATPDSDTPRLSRMRSQTFECSTSRQKVQPESIPTSPPVLSPRSSTQYSIGDPHSRSRPAYDQTAADVAAYRARQLSQRAAIEIMNFSRPKRASHHRSNSVGPPARASVLVGTLEMPPPTGLTRASTHMSTDTVVASKPLFRALSISHMDAGDFGMSDDPLGSPRTVSTRTIDAYGQPVNPGRMRPREAGQPPNMLRLRPRTNDSTMRVVWVSGVNSPSSSQTALPSQVPTMTPAAVELARARTPSISSSSMTLISHRARSVSPMAVDELPAQMPHIAQVMRNTMTTVPFPTASVAPVALRPRESLPSFPVLIPGAELNATQHAQRLSTVIGPTLSDSDSSDDSDVEGLAAGLSIPQRRALRTAPKSAAPSEDSDFGEPSRTMSRARSGRSRPQSKARSLPSRGPTPRLPELTKFAAAIEREKSPGPIVPIAVNIDRQSESPEDDAGSEMGTGQVVIVPGLSGTNVRVQSPPVVAPARRSLLTSSPENVSSLSAADTMSLAQRRSTPSLPSLRILTAPKSLPALARHASSSPDTLDTASRIPVYSRAELVVIEHYTRVVDLALTQSPDEQFDKRSSSAMHTVSSTSTWHSEFSEKVHEGAYNSGRAFASAHIYPNNFRPEARGSTSTNSIGSIPHIASVRPGNGKRHTLQSKSNNSTPLLSKTMPASLPDLVARCLWEVENLYPERNGSIAEVEPAVTSPSLQNESFRDISFDSSNLVPDDRSVSRHRPSLKDEKAAPRSDSPVQSPVSTNRQSTGKASSKSFKSGKSGTGLRLGSAAVSVRSFGSATASIGVGIAGGNNAHHPYAHDRAAVRLPPPPPLSDFGEFRPRQNPAFVAEGVAARASNAPASTAQSNGRAVQRPPIPSIPSFSTASTGSVSTGPSCHSAALGRPQIPQQSQTAVTRSVSPPTLTDLALFDEFRSIPFGAPSGGETPTGPAGRFAPTSRTTSPAAAQQAPRHFSPAPPYADRQRPRVDGLSNGGARNDGVGRGGGFSNNDANARASLSTRPSFLRQQSGGESYLLAPQGIADAMSRFGSSKLSFDSVLDGGSAPCAAGQSGAAGGAADAGPGARPAVANGRASGGDCELSPRDCAAALARAHAYARPSGLLLSGASPVDGARARVSNESNLRPSNTTNRGITIGIGGGAAAAGEVDGADDDSQSTRPSFNDPVSYTLCSPRFYTAAAQALGHDDARGLDRELELGGDRHSAEQSIGTPGAQGVAGGAGFATRNFSDGNGSSTGAGVSNGREPAKASQNGRDKLPPPPPSLQGGMLKSVRSFPDPGHGHGQGSRSAWATAAAFMTGGRKTSSRF